VLKTGGDSDSPSAAPYPGGLPVCTGPDFTNGKIRTEKNSLDFLSFSFQP
jgi:hypothetical protein